MDYDDIQNPGTADIQKSEPSFQPALSQLLVPKEQVTTF